MDIAVFRVHFFRCDEEGCKKVKLPPLRAHQIEAIKRSRHHLIILDTAVFRVHFFRCDEEGCKKVKLPPLRAHQIEAIKRSRHHLIILDKASAASPRTKFPSEIQPDSHFRPDGG